MALDSFFPEKRAGTEIYVLNLARELRKNGYMISIIIPSVGKDSFQYQYDEFPVYCFHVPKNPNLRELNGLEAPTGLEEFLSIIKEVSPDIVHLHSFTRAINSWHLRSVKELGIKTVFTPHLSGLFCIKGDLKLYDRKTCNGQVLRNRCLSCFIRSKKGWRFPIDHILVFIINNLVLKTRLKNHFSPALQIVEHKLRELKIIAEYADTVIAISDWIKKCFEINGISNVKIVKQGIDLSVHKIVPQKKKKHTPVRIIFIGRMHRDKGVHLLTNALKRMQPDSFHLTIVTSSLSGDNGYVQKIREEVVRFKNYIWLDNLSPEEVSDVLEDADVLCLPSIANEAAPLVILEAYAKKVPIIGSSFIAITDMVKDGCDGLLFESDDIDDLSKKIKSILAEPERIDKLSANIVAPRSMTDLVKDIMAEYSSIIRLP